ncbi:MAG: hypothetical protein AAFO79_00075, partial [Pseudomonadota bacterium]
MTPALTARLNSGVKNGLKNGPTAGVTAALLTVLICAAGIIAPGLSAPGYASDTRREALSGSWHSAHFADHRLVGQVVDAAGQPT